MISLVLYFCLRLAAVHAGSFTIRPYAPKACETHLMSESRRRDAEAWIKVDGVLVTGEFEHPTAEILADLRIDADLVERWRQDRARVLSIGEGMSGLVPYLRLRAVDATGVDLWYDSASSIPDNRDGRRMKSHLALYARWLETGDVRALSYPDDSVDVILSYKLFNNLDQREFAAGFAEMLRILKPGGEAFVHVPHDDEDEANYARFCATHANFVTDCRYENGTGYFRKLEPGRSSRWWERE